MRFFSEPSHTRSPVCAAAPTAARASGAGPRRQPGAAGIQAPRRTECLSLSSNKYTICYKWCKTICYNLAYAYVKTSLYFPGFLKIGCHWTIFAAEIGYVHQEQMGAESLLSPAFFLLILPKYESIAARKNHRLPSHPVGSG